MRHGRCLIPASGFFEWKSDGKAKVPHFIRPKDGGIFIFAGLVEAWLGPEEELETCAIITTEANALMAPIHGRMPVILNASDAEAWLDPANRHPEELLRPCDPAGMEAWPVGPAVGNTRNDGLDLIQRVEALPL